MTIDVWARQEAEKYAHGDVYGEIEPAFRDGVVMFADALLSDKAVEAAAWALIEAHNGQSHNADARTVLRAAIAAVTEGGE